MLRNWREESVQKCWREERVDPPRVMAGSAGWTKMDDIVANRRYLEY